MLISGQTMIGEAVVGRIFDDYRFCLVLFITKTSLENGGYCISSGVGREGKYTRDVTTSLRAKHTLKYKVSSFSRKIIAAIAGQNLHLTLTRTHTHTHSNEQKYTHILC